MNAPAAPPPARTSKRPKKPAALPFPGLVAVTRSGVVAVYRSTASTRREVELTGLLVATGRRVTKRRRGVDVQRVAWAWVTHQGEKTHDATAEERARLAATPEAPPGEVTAAAPASPVQLVVEVTTWCKLTRAQRSALHAETTWTKGPGVMRTEVLSADTAARVRQAAARVGAAGIEEVRDER